MTTEDATETGSAQTPERAGREGDVAAAVAVDDRRSTDVLVGDHLGPDEAAPEQSPSAAPGRVHFPCFEGLRALAAVMVVVHHASSLAGEGRSPAFVHRTASVLDSGVAVFFVISGFLIYRPFVAAHLAGRSPIRARAFFWRRLLRLVPAYWVALTFFWYLGNFHLGSDWWRYYLFGQIYSTTTTLGGLVQAWSLCTEVTFYLLVPVLAGALVLVVGRGVRSDRTVATVHLATCGLLAASAYVARAVISSRNPHWRGLSFQWLPTNLDLFAAGMALAVLSAWASRDDSLRARLDRLADRDWPWAAAAFGLFAWYAARVGPASFQAGYRGWFWQQRQLILATFTLLLLVPVVFGDQQRGPVRWVLRSRPVFWVGMVSYGLYLWHFDWMKRVVPNVNGFTGETVWAGWVHAGDGRAPLTLLLFVGLGVGSLFAAISWYLLEKPIERLKSAVR